MGKRRIPTREECITGIPIVLANAKAHLVGADTLAQGEQYGFAVAHLIYALEECEKARTLGKIALGVSMAEDEIKSGLYEHKERHVGAMVKSVSTGGALLEFVAESLRESVGKRSERREAELWGEINAKHPEVLPADWPETAGDMRVRNLYVDLRDAGWGAPRTPNLRSSSAFDRQSSGCSTTLKPHISWS